ncbi:MAG: flippase, partial [Lachnospiraceae bacterium]|nr:flippase [Lachnospiraceae bacterium]
ILTMSNIIFPLITFPYATRILLPAGMGKISFATSVVAYFSMFAQLGIPTYGVRTCAKIRDDKEKLSKTVQELLLINIITVLISYAVFAGAILAVPRFNREKELLIVMGISILLNAMGVEWLYKALEQYSYITIRSIIFKVVALLSMFLLIHNKEDYIIYGGITIFAASASNILNFINLRKHIILKPLGGYELKKHMKPMLVFFAVSVAATIYTNLDNVMLGFMKDDTEVGYYTAAVKVKTILVSFITSASVVLLPRASLYIEKGAKDEFYRILNKTLRLILLMAIPLAIYFIMYAEESILLLSGKEFIDSILPMQIIMPTLIFIGMTNLIGIQMLVPLGKEMLVFWSEVAGAIIDLILNAILIPSYGAAGAAVGTLVAEIAVLTLQIIFVRDKVRNLFKNVSWVKMFMANFLAILVSFWVMVMGWGTFITLLLSALMYFVMYGASLLLLKESLIREILTKKKTKI